MDGLAREETGDSAKQSSPQSYGRTLLLSPSCGYRIERPPLKIPEGGCAVWCTGKKFATNPMASSSFVVEPNAAGPIPLGIVQELSFLYFSGTDSGTFELGWSASHSSRIRTTEKNFSICQDDFDADAPVLSGAEVWVSCHKQSAINKFFTGTDSSRTVNGIHYDIRRYLPCIDDLVVRISNWAGQTFLIDARHSRIRPGRVSLL